ncbi:hypothetical protein V6N13_045307 [Hibiscus sabdariffa]|uniref:SOSS complex subunit B homolog n=1 Tax=Hibiscus sabdariffa TaxID=183260 RepID=A0ABR2RL52_9ROSI
MCLALVADKTAAVHLQLWGEECEAFEAGDIIRMENGIFSYNKNNLVLRVGKRGRIEKVGEFTMEFVETPNLSEIKWFPILTIPTDMLDTLLFPPIHVSSPQFSSFSCLGFLLAVSMFPFHH